MQADLSTADGGKITAEGRRFRGAENGKGRWIGMKGIRSALSVLTALILLCACGAAGGEKTVIPEIRTESFEVPDNEALRLIPPRNMSLEQHLEFLADDELLEVTPKSLRMRKRILDHTQRMKVWSREK